MTFVFINYKFAGKWLQSILFLAKKIFLKPKSLYCEKYIYNVTGQRGRIVIEDTESFKAKPFLCVKRAGPVRSMQNISAFVKGCPVVGNSCMCISLYEKDSL